MQSSSERIADVLNAWHAVIGDKEITSSQLLKRTAGGAQRVPAIRKLRDALQAVFPRQKLNAQRLGMWLSKHRGIESGELRLSGDYDTHKNRWIWTVFRPASSKEIEIELEEFGLRLLDQRNEKMVGKNLDQQLKQIEQDDAKLDQLDDQRRADASDKEYQKREAANKEAIQVIDKVEKRPHKNVFLAPATTGFFLFEAKTEKRCRDLQALGFRASMGYLSPERFVIFIDGEPDMKELKRVALRFMLKVYESVSTPAKTKLDSVETELIWSSRMQTWLPKPTTAMPLGYNPDLKFLRRAFVEDHERAGPAIRSNPYLVFPWNVFTE